MDVKHRHLFNFAASYQSGGLKRLQEYARWFNANGGASFIIHPNCAGLRDEYPANRYYVASQSVFDRVLGNTEYLTDVCADIGEPTLYYSYGIPVFRRIGAVNWFHLSNVLPFEMDRVPLSATDRLKFSFMGWQIRRWGRNADVVSAESRSSLRQLPAMGSAKLCVSVNGSDDELERLTWPAGVVEAVAVVVGTVWYKALDDAFRVFEMLRRTEPDLKLIVIGREDWVPQSFKSHDDVVIRGQIPRADVIQQLARARYYISTTLVENSYNAASEGVFLARESFLSDIGPHRELLEGSPHSTVEVPGLSRPVLRVTRDEASARILKTWDHVIRDMLAVADEGGPGAGNVSDA